MFFRAHPFGVLTGNRQLEAVPLAIGKTDCIRGETLVSGYRHAGRGIQPAAIQNYRFSLHVGELLECDTNFIDRNAIVLLTY
jgi:hypothetical protein